MMQASEIILERDEMVTESDRVFRRHNQEFLDNLPPDIVQEMARRRLAEIQAIKTKRAKATVPAGENGHETERLDQKAD
jgi:hypothetical protein